MYVVSTFPKRTGHAQISTTMGDFQANFRRPKESGIHTVEGNVAGARAAELVRQREQDQEAFEALKRQKLSNAAATPQFDDKFSGAATTKIEETFRDATVGLVTAEEFKRLQKEKEQGSQQLPVESNQAKLSREKAEKKERKRKLKEKRKQMATLSFAFEEEEDEATVNDAKPDLAPKKDPTVNTSFLPDRDREREQRETRERLEQEWRDQQAKLRQEPLEIVYSYWDGSGHRRVLSCVKGDTIGSFLELVRQQLSSEFRELANIAADALLYVKEDLILPHDLSFYDLIVSKARGKSGPLFHFDVHDDVRLGAIDVRVEKDESHPGKIVQRHVSCKR